MRKRAVEKRRDLKKIIDRRLKVHDQVSKKWEKIRKEKRQKMKPLEPIMKKERLDKRKKPEKSPRREKSQREPRSKKRL